MYECIQSSTTWIAVLLSIDTIFTSFPLTSTGSGSRSGPLLAMFPGQMYGAAQLAKDEAREVKDDGASGKHLHSSPLPENPFTHSHKSTQPTGFSLDFKCCWYVGFCRD